jgi:uncharacterized membrane protein YkvA (DUF1232 family)
MGKALWLTRLFGRRRILGKAGAALRTLGPLIRDVVSGRYRPVPWKALGLAAGAFVYLISPLDLIPDVLVGLGLLDDLVIVTWLLGKLDDALEDYRCWRGEASPKE